MGFFDRFKRKHEVAPSALPKVARGEGAAEKKAGQTVDAAVPAKKQESPATRTISFADDRGVLVKPVVTEKSTRLGSMGQYAFLVAPSASKGAIAEAVRRRWGIKPVAVTVQRYEGNAVRFGRRIGVQNDFKKAIVTLPKGQTIDVLKAGEKS